MGSFVVTVVGDNPEDQMLKYSSVSRVECPNPYFQTTDITALLKEQCPSDYEGSISDYLRNECEYLCIYELKAGQALDIYDDHQNGHFIVDDAGDVVTVFERKNPLEECDGFVLGGGYAGFYFIKPGHTGIEVGTPRRGTVIRPNTADKILKGSIDFERMMGKPLTTQLNIMTPSLLWPQSITIILAKNLKKSFMKAPRMEHFLSMPAMMITIRNEVIF